jgi:hypothetical protein
MHNHCCRIKAVSIRYSECVSVALVIQHAKSMRRVVFSSVAYTALPYISTYFIKGTILGEKIIDDKIYFFLISQQRLPETLIILRIQ